MHFRLPRDGSSLAFQLLRTDYQIILTSIKYQIAKPISTDLPHCLLSRGLSLVANAMLWAIISIWIHSLNTQAEFFPIFFLAKWCSSSGRSGTSSGSDKRTLTWVSSIQNTAQDIALVSPHIDFVHQLIMVQNFRSLKALHMQIMTFLLTSYKAGKRGAKRVRNLVCGIQEDFIAIWWMLSFDSVCHHFPITLYVSYPRKLALPCSGTSRKCESLEKHVGR